MLPTNYNPAAGIRPAWIVGGIVVAVVAVAIIRRLMPERTSKRPARQRAVATAVPAEGRTEPQETVA